MDPFNTALSTACQSLPIVPKGLMEIKYVLWTPLILLLVLLKLVYLFPLSLRDQWKVRYVLWTPLTLSLVLLVHPITFVPKGLMDSKGCSMYSFNTAFSSSCPSHHFCP